MKPILAIGAAALACLALAAAVAASVVRHDGRRADNSAARVLYDCASSRTGLLQHVYSVRVLRIAERRITGDVAEYTGCGDAIHTAIRRSRGDVVAGIKRSRHGRLAAGRIALLDQRGRKVDTIQLRKGERARFRVIPGRYRLRADGRRPCIVNVRATQWRTAEANVVCRG
jgi:hypothetical protein